MGAETSTYGIWMKVGVVMVETWADIEGVVALHFRNVGTRALDLLIAPLTEPREKLKSKESS